MTARDGAVPALRAARGGPPAWHALPASEVLKRLASRPDGLTAGEAAERLARVGLNVFEAAQPVAAWRVLVAQLRSVIVLLLALGVAVALAAGDTLDAVAIAAVLVLNTAIGFATELRAHRAMESLRALDVTRATVVREGRPRGLDARELVPGDVIELEEGHAVPADARLIQGVELTAAEASLTGEPAPVEKDAHAALPDDAPIGDRVTMVYKATTVTGGRGRAVVVATGMATEVGRIGALAAAVAPEPTPLERRLDQLGRRLAVAAVAVAAVVAALGLTQGAALADILQTAIALAVAAVPEGLPVVGTIAMAIGVRRMARRHALVRRLPVVETLGSATVICTDKTGTLTAGTMAVTVIRLLDRGVTLERALPAPDRSQTLALAPPDPRALLVLRVAALANRTRTDAGSGPAAADPTEAALVAAGRAAGLDVERLRAEWPEVAEIPFSSERMLMATFHRTGEGLVACVKGAPSRVVELCDRALAPEGPRPLDQRGREQLLELNADLAARGLRVLAVAYRELGATLDTELSGLTWIGYVGLADPPAPGVRDTIAAFAGAGIRTVMLTGDQKLTAQAVARELGLPGADREPLDGRELGRLEGSALEAAVGHAAVFSRVSPEDKLRIVEAYRRTGQIVAMLGDGVNDAAALRRAHIGVAMGLRGTDLAKEAADVILQDDRFPTVAAAVEEGRVVFDNIRKFVFYLFSCNLAEILVILGGGIIGAAPLRPLQILWLNLLTDSLPALALAVEPGERDVMRQPPRDPRAAILSGAMVRLVLGYGALIAACSLAAFAWGLAVDDSAARAGTLAFMTLAFGQVVHLGNARSRGPVLAPRRAFANRAALAAALAAIGLQLIAAALPPLARVLRIAPLDPADWTMVAALSALPGILGQTIKWVGRRRAGTG